MADVTLYLFDGSNLFHAGGFRDRDRLVDELASFVAVRGARGVVVFDGAGADHEVGLLAVRYAAHADTLLERLAATHRLGESVLLVTSDAAIRGTSGQEVQKRGSAGFLSELGDGQCIARRRRAASAIASTTETRARLERLRRAQD